MAGILDEVMDGITKKETLGQKPPEQTQPPNTAEGENPMNTYSEQFKERYGEKK